MFAQKGLADMKNHRQIFTNNLVSGSLLLFALNLFLSWRLLFVVYSDQMGSMEAAFISLAHQIKGHWGMMFGWWPFWYGGMPFHHTYPPLFHFATAVLAGAADVSEARAYHIVVTLGYALGPVMLFLLASRLSRSISFSFFAALIYSVWSPSMLLFSDIARDAGGLLLAQRLHSLVSYGDGPHVVGLTFIPLAILSLDWCCQRLSLVRVVVAALPIALVLLLNWPSTIELCFGILAYTLAKCSKWYEFAVIVAVCGFAYSMSSYWIPPSNMWRIQTNTQLMNSKYQFRIDHIVYAGGYLLLLIVLRILAIKLRIPETLRFFGFLLIPVAALVTGHYWFQVELLAQPWRFALCFEMALICMVVFTVHTLELRPLPARLLAIAMLVLCAAQAWHYRIYARHLIHSTDIAKTSEFKMSTWIGHHLAAERVMVPGSISFWLNAFSDSPQLTGCCDQGVLLREAQYAQYEIQSDDGAFDQALPISLLWLKAMGVQAIGVAGPRSSEWYKAIRHPDKFKGALEVLWSEGDDVIYRVPQRDDSVVHVLKRNQLVSRAPINGVDVQPLRDYVDAIEDEHSPRVKVRSNSSSHLQIDADLKPGDLLSIQIAAHEGWRATRNNKPVVVSHDALGFITVDPACIGKCTVDLDFTGGKEAFFTAIISSASFLFCISVIALKAFGRLWPMEDNRLTV